MTEFAEHATHTTIVAAAPVVVPADAEARLAIHVRCASACDLHGAGVRIVDAEDKTIVDGLTLAQYDDTTNATAEFALKAPIRPGDYRWIAVFPEHTDQGVVHGASSAEFAFTVQPHTPRVRILDLPDPVTGGAEFTIRIGAECPAGCKLAGTPFEIYDHASVLIAQGTLQASDGNTPWGASVAVTAPDQEGHDMWTAKLLTPDLALPHTEAVCSFHFGVSRPAENVMRIDVVDRETQTPVPGAEVLVRPRAYTGVAFSDHADASGVARIDIPQGEYQVYVSWNGKECYLPVVPVTGDVSIRAELAPAAPPEF